MSDSLVFNVNIELLPSTSRNAIEGVCRIGTGKPDSNGTYPESQVKIVDGRPEAGQ